MKQSNHNLCGAILTAGEGKRIKALYPRIPKSLLPVCNKPIIQYQIEYMKDLGIHDFYIVVGHLKEKIIKLLGDGISLGVKINYVEQKRALGIAYAVGLLENYISRPFLLILGDIFFIPKNFKQLTKVFSSKEPKTLLAVAREKDPIAMQKNFAVIIERGSGQVRRVIEKPSYPTTNLKGCGIYLFGPVVFDAIRNTPRTVLRDEYEITTSIQVLIENGHTVYPVAVTKYDVNVTFPCDLWKCNQIQLHQSKKGAIIDPTAKIHPKAKIINSVIGKRVMVEHPILIKNSVILEGTKINTKKGIRNKIISPWLTLSCGGT